MNFQKEAVKEVEQKKDHVKLMPTRQMYGYVGMNAAAAKAMGFPWKYGNNTTLIDQNLHGLQEKKTEIHELVEKHFMDLGEPYWKAHKKATTAEKIISHDKKKYTNYPRKFKEYIY